MTYRCADCRETYTDCKCKVYMSQAYVERGARKRPKAKRGTMSRKAKQNALVSLLAASVGLLATGCASTRPAPVHFVAPSVAPVKQAVTRVEQHVKGATDAAAKLAQECETKSAGWADAYNELQSRLNSAEAGLASINDLADSWHNEAVRQATQANITAQQRDQYAAKVDSIAASRHGWVKRFWYATGLAIALGLWTFRKPLLLAVGL